MKTTINIAFLVFCISGFCSFSFAGEFKIYPTSIIVKTGHTVRFTAVAEESTTRNFTPDNCQWSATGGEIDGEGNYHAYSLPGTYEVSVFAGSRRAKARITVVPSMSGAPVKPGAIFIRQWHFYPTEATGQTNMRVSALIKGETVKIARIFLINPDGSETMLGETGTHHNGRARFQAFYTPTQGQWLDFKSYDHLGRIVAHTRRML